MPAGTSLPDADDAPPPRVLVIGCGNPLDGDDAVGPEAVRRLSARGLPDGVACIDAGTGGLDAILRMRGVPEVIVVDAGSSGRAAGTVVEIAGDAIPRPEAGGLSIHSLRWDQAIALARPLLDDAFPKRLTAMLVEGVRFEPGEPLSPAVDRGVDRLVDRLHARLAGGA